MCFLACFSAYSENEFIPLPYSTPTRALLAAYTSTFSMLALTILTVHDLPLTFCFRPAPVSFPLFQILSGRSRALP